MGNVRPAPPCAACGGADFEKERIVSPDGLYFQPTGDGAGWGRKLGAMFRRGNAIDALLCARCGRIALYAADRSPRA